MLLSFFFSSRRRHTRSYGDWSSDVCSSDLVARAALRRVLAATYHQVWWPDATEVRYDGVELSVWDEGIGGYLDPATGEVLTAWDEVLDVIGDDAEPWHVARFRVRFDAQGVLAGSKDAA